MEDTHEDTDFEYDEFSSPASIMVSESEEVIKNQSALSSTAKKIVKKCHKKLTLEKRLGATLISPIKLQSRLTKLSGE